ncbi:MAG: YhcH/YjgK/YiaL family protein [bacterium]|nr:YhcH/YjgK/YiaL family protein [bacterium]MDO5462861.1 YhcH/YjgK/YiaL family protein [bacterium]
MIVDTLDHASNYPLGERFNKAFAWLKDPANTALPPGHYVLEQAADGTELLYANIQEYETRTPENCPLEYHRAYADIQLLTEGCEAIGYRVLTEDLETLKPYDPQNDIGFVKGEGTPIPFEKNTFFVLFPQDAHAPGKRVPSATRVKKIVVKVKL